MVEKIDLRLNIENNKSTTSDMDVDRFNIMESSLRSLKLSTVEKFMDNFKHNGDVLFASFEMYDNTHPVNESLMLDIAIFACKSLDISKHINLYGLRFWRVAH